MGLVPKEFEVRQSVTVGFVVWIAAVSFSLGTIYTKIISQSENIEKAREYVEQEVGGLRSDWERDRQAQEKRLEKLEKVYEK